MDLEAGEVAEEAVFPNYVESRSQIDLDNDGSLFPLKAVEGLLSNVRQDIGRHSAPLESCLLGRNGFDVAGPLLEPNGDEALHDLGDTRQQRYRKVAFYLARWLSVLQNWNVDRFSPFARCSSFGPTPVANGESANGERLHEAADVDPETTHRTMSRVIYPKLAKLVSLNPDNYTNMISGDFYLDLNSRQK